MNGCTGHWTSGAPGHENGASLRKGWWGWEGGPTVNGHGNGGGSKGDGKGDSFSPRIAVTVLQPGEHVEAFHRYVQDPNGYFMVDCRSAGFMHPSIGRTDGWTTAVVTQPWDICHYDPSNYKTWPEIMWTHPTWYNRRGIKLNEADPGQVTQRIAADQIRQRAFPMEASRWPKLSLVHVRWGGETPVNPVTEGAGGWGNIGSTPSDNYINALENQIYSTLGPTYEIISIFYQNSAELVKVHAPLVRNMLRGKAVGALYFMWPIPYQDGHEFPAYVDRSRQFELMVSMESAGIPSRFPHSACLYRLFASKEWTSQCCLHPLLKTPLTTMVSRQAVALNSDQAAAAALAALQNLAEARAAFNGKLKYGDMEVKPVTRGVAKLGWSWEAADVSAWKTRPELARVLRNLAEQPGSYLDNVFVQEWVDFDVEMRHYIVEPDLNREATLKPVKTVYTGFKVQEQGYFREFDRFDRGKCVDQWFHRDEAAVADAEAQCRELMRHYLQWLQAMAHELPTVIRFDVLCKRVGPGKAAVTMGELTELGGCFLGWGQGPQVVFSAMIRSFFCGFDP